MRESEHQACARSGNSTRGCSKACGFSIYRVNPIALSSVSYLSNLLDYDWHIVPARSHVRGERRAVILVGMDAEVGAAAELSDYQFPRTLFQIVPRAGSGIGGSEGVGFVSRHDYLRNMRSHKRFAFSVFRGVNVLRCRASFLVSLVGEYLVFPVDESCEPFGHFQDVLLVQLLPSRIVERNVFEDVAEKYLAVFWLGDSWDVRPVKPTPILS